MRPDDPRVAEGRISGRMDHRRGAAASELAVILAPMIILLLGLLELGRLVEVRQILSNAAREGGRQASTGRLTDTQVAQISRDYLKNASLPIQNVVIAVQNLTAPGTDSRAAAQLDRIQVTVTIPFNDVRLVNSSFVTAPATTLTGQAVWYSMKDKPYAPPPEPPIE